MKNPLAWTRIARHGLIQTRVPKHLGKLTRMIRQLNLHTEGQYYRTHARITDRDGDNRSGDWFTGQAGLSLRTRMTYLSGDQPSGHCKLPHTPPPKESRIKSLAKTVRALE